MSSFNKQGCVWFYLGDKLYHQVWYGDGSASALLVTPRPDRDFHEDWAVIETTIMKDMAAHHCDAPAAPFVVGQLIAEGWVITHLAEPLVNKLMP